MRILVVEDEPTLRAQLQRGQVRTCAGFGITLAPVVLAGQDSGQVVGLLRLAAIAHDHRPDHAQAHWGEAGRAGPGGIV